MFVGRLVTVCSKVLVSSTGEVLPSALGCKEPVPPLVLFVSLLDYIQEFFLAKKKSQTPETSFFIL